MRKWIFIFFILPIIGEAQSILAGDSVSAGIVYKNMKDSLVPLVFNTTYTIGIDIDSDLTYDFEFKTFIQSAASYSYMRKYCTPLNGFEQASTLSNAAEIDTLVFGEAIDNAMNWTTSAKILKHVDSYPMSYIAYGVFSDRDHYFGFRKKLANDTIYGWFLVNINVPGIIIRSYAYKKNCNNTPSLLISASSPVICSGESVTISVGGAVSYTWSTGSNSQSIVVTPSVTTSYSVDGTNSLGCIKNAVITQTVNSCIGIEEYKMEQIQIYPNPGNSIIQITGIENKIINGKMELVNYLGQTVLKTEYKKQIDVSELESGIYTLRIITKENQNYYSKFVKE